MPDFNESNSALASSVEDVLSHTKWSTRFFEQGDFGSLKQFEFSHNRLEGCVDIWGQGWFGITIWDSANESTLLNILISPEEQDEIDPSLEKLKNFIA